MSRGYERMQSKQFEHTRAITYMMAATNRDSAKNFPTMQQFWPLPTDAIEEERKKDEAMEFYEQMKVKLQKAFPNQFKGRA